MDSNDVNQVGTSTDPNTNSPGNYLTPQQRMQMGQYANSLMKNQQPAHSWSEGLGNMVNSYMGGQAMNQAYPSSGSPTAGSGILGALTGGLNQSPQGTGILGMLTGNGGNGPMQLASANGGASGPPMQLPSAGGGSSPLGIFQGLFGGGNGSTS